MPMEHMQGWRNGLAVDRELSWLPGMGQPQLKSSLVLVLHQMSLVGCDGGSSKVKVPR